jgi:hypothetical protein
MDYSKLKDGLPIKPAQANGYVEGLEKGFAGELNESVTTNEGLVGLAVGAAVALYDVLKGNGLGEAVVDSCAADKVTREGLKVLQSKEDLSTGLESVAPTVAAKVGYEVGGGGGTGAVAAVAAGGLVDAGVKAIKKATTRPDNTASFAP